jgi:hypothetical protein
MLSYCKAPHRTIASLPVHLALGAIFWFTSCTGQASLEFNQMEVVQVPDSFAVTDIGLTESGSAVLVSRARPYVLSRTREGAFVEVGEGVLASPLAAFNSHDGTVYVADGKLNALLTIQGTLVTSYVSLDHYGELLAATRSSHGSWSMLARGHGATALLELRPGDSVPRVVLDAVPISHDRPPRLAVSPAGQVFLVDIDRPSVIWHLNLSGDLAPVNVWLGSNEGSVTPHWIAAGLVPLGDHILYTVADLRSDRRVLALLDGHGNVVRSSDVSGPFAFAASSTGDSALIALRALNVQELVYYRWKWRGR